MANWILPAIITLAVILIPVLIYPAFAKIRRRSSSPRPDGLQIISNPPDAKFEIVAVHGLGAHPEYTWMCGAPTNEASESYRPGKVHLLRDLLKSDFPEARILSFAYNCDWLIDAPVKTVQQIGETLHDTLVQHQSTYPVIPKFFIGHSFGGIIIKMALCKFGDCTQELVDNTCGIIFLGTPHHGSGASIAAYAVARLTGFLGSNPEMLLTLTSHQKELSDLEDRFIDCMKQKDDRRQRTEIVSFCETKPTYMLGWLSLGIIVPRDSARGSHAARAIPIDTDHSGLNKCGERNTQLYRELQKQLQRLRPTTKPSLSSNQRIALEKLNGLDSAAFDSHDNEHNAMCLDGTRREILEQIKQWAYTLDQGQIYWLQGMAGTGKSTIARTIARDLDSVNRLAGSFFFKRGEGDRGNARRFFITMAAQIVLMLPEMAELVRNALEAEPGVIHKSLRDQFEKLILEPMKIARCDHSTPLTIVIDALDECEGDGDIKNIIYQLSRMNNEEKLPIKFLVTSRFEPPIRLGFQDIHGQYIEFPLHTIPEGEIRRDIEAFLQHRLKEIRHRCKMNSAWPTKTQFQQLLDMADPLFIFAATACRMIEDHRQGGGADKRLNEILQYKAQGQLKSTYLPALNQMVLGLSKKKHNEAIKEFKLIVGTIMTLARPLSAESLARLLRIDLDCVCDRLEYLHSVLDIPSNTSIPVRLFHESFRDFLTNADQKDTHEFWIDKREVHEMLASRCLQVLSGGHLKNDICGLEEPGTSCDQINPETIDTCLPSEVQYACLHWVYHLKESHGLLGDDHEAHGFLQCHFLHWLEALSLIGRASESVKMIEELQGLVPATNGIEVGAFLQDAERFTLYFLPIIVSAPLQLYMSGLLFSPMNSIIRQTFQKYAPKCVIKDSWPNLDWSPCRQILTGHTKAVKEAAFSMDGQRIISGSSDKTIRIWNAGTGACMQTLKGHTDTVTCVTFSANEQHVLSGADDRTIRMWDAETGSCLRVYNHKNAEIMSTASSADGHWIASASYDGTIKVWDANTDACIQTFKDRGRTALIAFLDNEKRLISVNLYGGIKSWNVNTGACVQTWNIHKGKTSSPIAESCALSTDQRLVAFAYYRDEHVIWNTNTDTCELMLQHDGSAWCYSIAFSSDGQRVIGADRQGIIRIWDVTTGKHLETLRESTVGTSSIAFSPDGQRIASGNLDGIVRIWDATSESLTIPPVSIEADETLGEIMLSTDGKWAISMSEDEDSYTIRIWDAETGACILTQHHDDVPVDTGGFCSMFSTDGQWIAYSYGNLLTIWDFHTETRKQSLSGHAWDIRAIAFSTDSKRVASQSYDSEIKVWDVSEGACIGTFETDIDDQLRSPRMVSVLYWWTKTPAL